MSDHYSLFGNDKKAAAFGLDLPVLAPSSRERNGNVRGRSTKNNGDLTAQNVNHVSGEMSTDELANGAVDTGNRGRCSRMYHTGIPSRRCYSLGSIQGGLERSSPSFGQRKHEAICKMPKKTCYFFCELSRICRERLSAAVNDALSTRNFASEHFYRFHLPSKA